MRSLSFLLVVFPSVIALLCLVPVQGDGGLFFRPWLMDRLRVRAQPHGMSWNALHDDSYTDFSDNSEKDDSDQNEQSESDFSFKGDIKRIFDTDFEQEPMPHMLPTSPMFRPKKATDAFRLKRDEEQNTNNTPYVLLKKKENKAFRLKRDEEENSNSPYIMLKKKENKAFRLKKDVVNGAFRLKKSNQPTSFRLKRA